MVISVNTPSKQYNVISSRGAITQLVPVMQSLVPHARVAILTDDNVNALHADSVTAFLDRADIKWCKYVIEHGERSKTPETLFNFLEFMAEHSIRRSDIVIALGGGVVGDIAGFAASIYQRGIDFIQIPTTLLAMVDSSVGGKTAVDLKAGKNLAGAFHQPIAVICDTDFLSTLSKKDFRDGCAEIIKYGITLDKELFDALSKGIDTCLERAITRSVELKRDVVTLDERDNGQRAILNFGHTFGHAIEKLSSFELTHGECVAKGMYIASKVARELQISDLTKETKNILEDYTFDLHLPYSARQIAKAALSDKKANADKITLILPEKIGKAVLYPIEISKLEEILERSLG